VWAYTLGEAKNMKLPGIIGETWKVAGQVQARKHLKLKEFLVLYEKYAQQGKSDGAAAFEACRDLNILEEDLGPRCRR
jgi:hypothetical protein